MIKFLKILLFSVLILVVGGFIFLYIYYHTYSPERKNIIINEADLVYFHESYEDSRNSFLHCVEELKPGFSDIETFEFKVSSNVDSNLVMDLCYIPPQLDTSRLLVLVSGIHGIEGYTGSAIQQMFMTELLDDELVNDMGILFVHAFNPFGFKYNRKTTEFNVDLNRNCGIDNSLFENTNPGYRDLFELLNPSGKANKNSLYNQFFYLDAIWNIIKESMATLRQAALQGQYEYPEGIYYGGKEFTPQTRALQSILPDIFNPYDLIYAIDFHTGYGEWSNLHLFSNPENSEYRMSLIEHIFEGHHIDWGNSDDFYTVVGDLSGFLKQVNPDAVTLSMPFEFGTFNSQETIGSLLSIQRMILENQGFHHGFKSPISETKVKNEFREMYYPSSEAWRSEVIRQSREMLKFSIDRFKKLDLD